MQTRSLTAATGHALLVRLSGTPAAFAHMRPSLITGCRRCLRELVAPVTGVFGDLLWRQPQHLQVSPGMAWGVVDVAISGTNADIPDV